jgi:hypothetical protein
MDNMDDGGTNGWIDEMVGLKGTEGVMVKSSVTWRAGIGIGMEWLSTPAYNDG